MRPEDIEQAVLVRALPVEEVDEGPLKAKDVVGQKPVPVHRWDPNEVLRTEVRHHGLEPILILTSRTQTDTASEWIVRGPN